MTATLPRVTEILTRVGLSLDYERLVPADKLTMLRQRGTALHRAIQLWDAHRLDVARVHEAILPGLTAYQAWAQDVKHEPWASELELTHSTWGFMGHPDRVGLVNGEPAVIDWKYTDGPDLRGGKYQLAGYKMLANDQGRAAAPPVSGLDRIHETYLVQLSPTGKGYHMHRMTDPTAEQVFQAAVILYHALQNGDR